MMCLMLYALPHALMATIKLGISSPLTGHLSHFGKDFIRGIKFALDNHPYHTCELIIKDDQYKPEKTIQNTIDFIKKERVDYLFGYIGTPTVSAILPLLVKHHQHLFFPYTGAEVLHHPPYDKFVFNLRPSYWNELHALIDYAYKHKKTKIAVFYQRDGYGMNGLLGIREKLHQLNSKALIEVNYVRGQTYQTSFEKEAALILSKKPDFILCVSTFQVSAAFIRDVRNMGSDVLIGNMSSASKEIVQELLIKDNSRYFNNLVHSQVFSDFDSSVAMQTYLKKAKHAYNSIEFEGYLAGKAFLQFLDFKQKFPNDPPSKIFARFKNVNLGLSQPVTQIKNQLLRNVYLVKSDKNKWVPI